MDELFCNVVVQSVSRVIGELVCLSCNKYQRVDGIRGRDFIDVHTVEKVMVLSYM